MQIKDFLDEMVVNNYFLKRQFKIYESFLRSDLEFEEIADDNPTLINHWLYPLGYLICITFC